MARRNSAPKNPWPEKIKFEVLKDLERSGVHWFPRNHWLRTAGGGIPDRVPSLGQRGSEVEGRQESHMIVRVVNSPTGAPEEMTPAEIYSLMKSDTIMPTENIKGIKELLMEGARSSKSQEVRLVPPMRMIPRNYESASEVPLTSEGAMNRGKFAEVTDFSPGVLARFMR
jgi:hypothetical protein